MIERHLTIHIPNCGTSQSIRGIPMNQCKETGQWTGDKQATSLKVIVGSPILPVITATSQLLVMVLVHM